MVRSRSRSPARRERRRSRSRSRERDRERNSRRGNSERHRTRSASPRRRRPSRSPPRRRSRSPRRRSRSRSQDRHGSKGEKKGAVPKFLMDRPSITEKDLEGKSVEEQEMMKLMGFGDFETSKGKKVPGNHTFGLHVIHKRKYRQYMNRKGGFNRPLDFVS